MNHHGGLQQPSDIIEASQVTFNEFQLNTHFLQLQRELDADLLAPQDEDAFDPASFRNTHKFKGLRHLVGWEHDVNVIPNSKSVLSSGNDARVPPEDHGHPRILWRPTFLQVGHALTHHPTVLGDVGSD